MKGIVLVVVVAFTCRLVLGQIPFDGTCTSFEECRNPDLCFSAVEVYGLWFVYATIPFPSQIGYKCTFYTFNSSLTQTDEMIDFTEYEFNIETMASRVNVGNFGYDANGFLNVSYTELELPLLFQTLELTEDYWVVINCIDCGLYTEDGAGVHAFAFTREQFPTEEVTEDIKKAFEKCGYSRDILSYQDQNGCNFC